MKRVVLAMSVFLAGATFAQSAVQPRMAEAVRPRSAPRVESRTAPVGPPRRADADIPRAVEPMADTAVSGPVQAWAWQQLGATPVAGDGVARGMRLIDVRCAGVRCRVFADSAGGWVIRAEGGFPQLAGTTLRIFQADADARQTPMAERSRGVFSDGRFWDQVGTWQLPAGRYGVLYQPASGAQPVAAITFEVQRQAAAADGRDSGATTGGDAARLRAAEQARKLQRCLAMAAANPDVRCVRE